MTRTFLDPEIVEKVDKSYIVIVVVGVVIIVGVGVNVVLVALLVVADHIVYSCGQYMLILNGTIEFLWGGGGGVYKVIVVSNQATVWAKLCGC